MAPQPREDVVPSQTQADLPWEVQRAALERALTEAHTTIVEMRTSVSWRVTEPLRLLRAKVRGPR